MASSSSTHSKTQMQASSTPKDGSELADVQCYTCRKRHIRCDRTLPTCRKCDKKGVPCLGYQKPLRWADGVAVRGKLKGKSKPVVDADVIEMVNKNVQQQADSTYEKAAQFGVPLAEQPETQNAPADSQWMQLMGYYNHTLCAERVTIGQTTTLDRHLAPLSVDTASRLPRIIVDCILAISAVHMSLQNPGNKALERLALEKKVGAYQSHNKTMVTPRDQTDIRPDVAICVGSLIFAMDLLENGVDRWVVHAMGSLHIISSYGGIENLCFYYPHLQVLVYHLAHFETMWAALSHIPMTKVKHTTRAALEGLCHSPLVKRKTSNLCPTVLTLAMWDMGVCAQNLLSNDGPGLAEMYRRDKVLREVLEYQPTNTGFDSQNPEFMNRIPFFWENFNASWKAAITVLIIRYLYLGRPNLSPQVLSSSSSAMNQSRRSFTSQPDLNPYNQGTEEMEFSDSGDEFGINEEHADYLFPGPHHEDPFSRSASPTPSYMESPNEQLWNSRYKIHEEAFSSLFTSLMFLHDNTEPAYARYVLLPVFILGLVSRPGSKERALCLSYYARFESSVNNPPTNIGGGEKLGLDIPWEALDAYSEVISRGVTDIFLPEADTLVNSAPEWNWWDMLLSLDMNLTWPISAGTSRLECGSDYWAFKILSSVLTEECFSSWMQPTHPS
ncbi:unnamed protein product [Periconia digitata]|uniref:Zn(2)-C6 fungal-type domain-containing protein n=1 Tax=Periconia digitata TaxID=1303443 RepID=A0A9W4UER8_9PLEO|nr:unnamed protein product [Periconia digitata]